MWLHVENHYLNMVRALVVDDDATSTPPAVSVVFPGGVKRTLTGEARQEVLAWLARQREMAQGGVVNAKRPIVVGAHPPVNAVWSTRIPPGDSSEKRP